MAMDLQYLIGAEDRTGGATASARNNISSLSKSATESGSVFDRLFSGGGGAVSGFISKVASVSVQFVAIKYAAQMAFGAVVSAIAPGIEAIDAFTTRVVSTAALITSFKGGDNIAQTYQQAKVYAEGLQETLETIDAKTIASAQDLGLITDEMLKQRVVLDVNNQKQLDGFVNLANAVAVVAQGAGAKEIQIRQEIRALMTGEVNAQSTLAQQINAMVGGGLKQKVELWKQEGTLVENIGKALQGYAAAQGDISSTWGAVKSSMESIFNAILRSGFKDVFRDVVSLMDELNLGAKENAEWIGNKIQQGWLVVKGLAESVYFLFRTYREPLGMVWELTKMVVEGWGILLYAVLPPLHDRMGKFGLAVWENVKMLGNLLDMLWKGMSFDFSGAYAAFQDAKANFAAGGRLVGEAFVGGLGDEIKTRAEKFLSLDLLKGKSKSSIVTPDLGKAPVTEEERKAIGSAASALGRYSDAVKDVGKSRLSLASSQFNDDLKRQAELLEENGRVFNDIRGPVSKYLELIDDVEAAQTRLENKLGGALEKLADQRGGKDAKGKLQGDLEKAQAKHELALLDISRRGADERLKVWTSYYDSLKGVVEKKQKEVEELHEKMMVARVKIEEAIAANNKTLQGPGRELDPYEARLQAKADILAAVQKASTGGDAQAGLKALDDLVARAQELASAVSLDGQDVISKVDAVNQSNEVLRTIGEAQDKLHTQAIENAEKDVARLKNEMRGALDNIEEIRGKIEELDNRIAAMQTSISLVAEDKVSPVLDKIKAQIDAIRSATVTVDASYSPSYPSGAVDLGSPFIPDSYASGTSYVPRTGFYQLHQGEVVKNRIEAGEENSGRVVRMSFGDVNLSFPNVRKEADARGAARLFFEELQTLEQRRRA